jgi:hypothetical protein
MNDRKRRVRPALMVKVAALAGIAILGYVLFLRVPPGPRSIRVFDPDRTADLELRMWQAYYDKQNVRLFGLLVTLLHEQNRYTWATSVAAGFHLARAAAAFGNLEGGYAQVLPDLETAYRIEQHWIGAAFDPSAVARAELAWWIARRVPGQNSPENVGRLISEEYSLLYEVPVERVKRAGLLRAEAGTLRDRGGRRADWQAVGALLRQAYQELRAGVTPR